MARPKARFNKRWGEHIRELLDKYGLSPRKAEEAIDGMVSDSLISGMYHQSKLPPYETAVDFLGSFIKAYPESKHIAMECLHVANMPIPSDWLDPAEALEIALKAKGGITEAKREEIVETVRKMLAEVE